MTHTPEPAVLVRAARGVGRLTLNRPKAINALDIGMIRVLAETLDAWEHEVDVEVVLIDGAGERGLCAGGDVRALYGELQAGNADGAAQFFREEYALNARIAEYPKPIVVFADGVTMGGGIGIAGHASHRIVTERSRLAMPEVRIGFTPDVGGTLLLARAPGRIGEFLALTGGTIEGPDAVYAGFADHLVPSENLGGMLDALESRADPNGPAELVLLFDETPEVSRLERSREWIDDAFSGATLTSILERLDACTEPEARETAALMRTLPPTALTVALASVRRARELDDLRAVLAQEYALITWFGQTQPDMIEGIRAQLVDKDRSPNWNPAALSDVPPAIADEALAHAPAVPLWD